VSFLPPYLHADCSVLISLLRTALGAETPLKTKTVTLQENAQSAIMTQYGTDGLPVVYNCALGLDAQLVSMPIDGPS